MAGLARVHHIWRLVVAALALLAGIGGALVIAGTSSADSAAASSLPGGQTLTAGQSLESPDGHFELEMQTTGNLVEVEPSGGRTFWQSGTSGAGNYATVQANGELVVDSSDGETLWSNNVTTSGCAALNVLDDGNVEVDGPSSAVWSTGNVTNVFDGEELLGGQTIFSPNEAFELIMESTGDLALYNSSGTQIWDTGTGGNPGAFAVMQSDGNLVVYSNQVNGHSLWASNTGTSPSSTVGNPGAQLWVQSDGNLVVCADNSGPVLWQSHTNGAATGSGTISPTPQYGSPTACPTPVTPAPAPTTSTSAPAPTVTVTSTVDSVTSATPSPKTTRPAVRVALAFHWSWRGAYSYLSKITFGKLPSRLHWTATITPAKQHVKASSYRARTATQRHRLLLWLEHRRYTSGERVRLEIARTGDRAETITFTVRLHRLPSVSAPQATKSKGTRPKTR